MKHPPAVLIIAVLSVCLGIFFILSQRANKPIPRSEAVEYVGNFAEYESSQKYCGILFEDGSYYDVYAHTETEAFRDAMEGLAPGTKLYILVNPNNSCVAEVKTETEELLNFELSQQAIDAYDNGYIAIGWIACLSGVFLIVYVAASARYRKKEKQKKGGRKKGAGTSLLRQADTATKEKVLLKATVQGYEICYRRVRFVNELVVNGCVYDEKKGIIEFEHSLHAVVGGHEIEAGLDEDDFSYINFDRTLIKRKKRLI